MATAFAAFVDVRPSEIKSVIAEVPPPTRPQRVVPKTYHSVPLAHVDMELNNMQQNALNNEARESTSIPLMESPTTPRDIEMSRPASPATDGQTFEALQSFSNPPMNRFRMISVSLNNFAGGLSDSAPGALIPYIEQHYDIGYALVSTIFITNAVGFILAAFVVDVIRARLGRAGTLMFGCALLACGYIPIVCTPPFPVVVASFFLLGLGSAINLALGNVFAANLQNGTTMLGAMHGSYGLGGTLGPLMATAMVSSGQQLWSRYYLIPLGATIFNGVFAGWSFWHYERENAIPTLLTDLQQTQLRVQNPSSADGPITNSTRAQFVGMASAFKSKTVILGALFIFAYQGAEVSISGWVISFLITARNGNPSAVGYVTSGFWGGVTLGRFLLSSPAHRIGERIFVYGIVLGAAVFQLLVWFVPNVIGDAVAVALVGLLLGPVYPCATVIFSRLINKNDQVSSLSIISAFGSSGGAVAPFTTGILAQAVGTFVLHPIAIGLFGVMMACWYLLPQSKPKRTE